MQKKTELNEVLAAIGLNDAEIKVFQVLLANKTLRANDVSRKAGMNRTTSYSTLNSLIKKGLVTSIDDKKVLIFQSIEPHLLADYVERKRAQLGQNISAYKELLPDIERQRNKIGVFPKIQFFKGVEGIEQAYEGTLAIKEKELVAFTGADAIFGFMNEEWFDYYFKKRKSMGISARVIAPDTKWAHYARERDKKDFRTTRLIPDKFSFDTEIVIFGNKTGIISFSKEDPIAVIIEDERISNTLKNIFEYVWEKEGGVKKQPS